MSSPSAASDAGQPFGGTVPGDAGLLEVVNVKKLLLSRCLEIEELFGALKRDPKQEMVFQRLPFVLRRRSMSHNPFRVPKKLRLHLAREMARSVPKCSKRLRKDHRKRLNRLEEYRSRCARNQWLETHLYHAKRFMMGTLWGYRVALHTTQKCRRRCLRYCKRHSVVHDMSYVRVVRVSGRLSELRQSFSRIFADPSLMFEDHYMGGAYRSQAFAYATDGKSQRLICPVHFIWIPLRRGEREKDEGEGGGDVEMDLAPTDCVRQIWFFVHPSAVDEFCNTIRESKDNLECVHLNDFCIFEVMGPLSGLLLRSTLKVNAFVSTGNALWKSLHPENIDIPPSYILPLHVLDLNLYGNLRPAFKLESMRRQTFGSGKFQADDISIDERHHLCDFEKPANFSIVNKVNVPRLRKRNFGALVAKLLGTLNVRYPECRNGGSQNKLPSSSDGNSRPTSEKAGGGQQKAHGYTKAKGSTSDPPANNNNDTDADKNSDASCTPVWLIRRGDALGGFDVVMPAGTIARKLWILLNRYGALGIGLEERHMLYAQKNQCMFPQDYPETAAGQHHMHAAEAEMTRKYLSTPANKRPNYRLMGVDRPFSIPNFGITDTVIDGVRDTIMEDSSTSASSMRYMSKCNDRLVIFNCNNNQTVDRSSHANYSSCNDGEGIYQASHFRTVLPEEWIPRSYVGRMHGEYIQSRHLLLGCVTAGLHRIDPVSDHAFQVLRVSRSLYSTSSLYLTRLICSCVRTPHGKLVQVDNSLLLACSIEVAGHGSLSPGTRLYLPSDLDLETHSRFVARVMHGTFYGHSTVGTRRKTTGCYAPSSGTSKTVAAAEGFEEPIHEEYKLCNLKRLFGCPGKCKKVTPLAAMNGLQWLEARHRPPVRQCIGVVTSKGFSHRGNCIVHVPGFLKLLQGSLHMTSSKGKCEALLESLDRIRLFVWIREIHSREYMAGILSITLHDNIGGCI